MDTELCALLMKAAPPEKHAEWHQKTLRRAIQKWAEERPADYEMVINNGGFQGLVGYHIRPDGLGQYGHDTGFHFIPDIPEDIAREIEGGELAQPFYEEWINMFPKLFEEIQSDTMFSEKEFATLFLWKNPNWQEKAAADALSVTVGTYRGKVGRVREKITQARRTLDFADVFPGEDSGEEWQKLVNYSAPFYVVQNCDDDDLPVNGAGPSNGDIRKYPVEMLIR